MADLATALPHRTTAGPRLIRVAAPASPARRDLLARWTEAARRNGDAAYLLSGDFERSGPWAGLGELLTALVPSIRDHAPDLIERHAHELSLVLPRLRPELKVANLSLTDVASPEEKTRNYPMDRAFRILDGLVEMLDEWNRGSASTAWTLVCDDFDHAGALVRRFFQTLMRRRGESLELTLVVAGEPGAVEAIDFEGTASSVTIRPQLPSAPPSVPPSPEELGRRARELEDAVRRDPIELQEKLPQLIYLWRHSDTPERALSLQALAFGEYNHFGFYEDALRYGEAIVHDLDRISGPGKPFTRWNLVGALANCSLALGRPEQALEIIHREGLPYLDAGDLARAQYVLALIHSRFLAVPDFDRAESLIESGLEALTRSNLSSDQRHFLHVFLLNGLAFIRHRQKRPHEALELCQRGYELLQQTLDSGSHRLHRSVLLYNISQVYAALGSSEPAIAHLDAAIAYDPNYSEYYNERGNAFLQLGRLEEAVEDYRTAIRLSAPYHEVWTNMGQAFKLMGRLEEAVDAYGRALDIAPGQVLARIGRAQAWEATGRPEQAVADYSAALELDPDQPLVLGNRATLHYDAGDLAAALADLDRAVELAAQEPGIRYNRALVLSDLGRKADAAMELRCYLGLMPEADDRAEVEARIVTLERAA